MCVCVCERERERGKRETESYEGDEGRSEGEERGGSDRGNVGCGR